MGIIFLDTAKKGSKQNFVEHEGNIPQLVSSKEKKSTKEYVIFENKVLLSMQVSNKQLVFRILELKIVKSIQTQNILYSPNRINRSLSQLQPITITTFQLCKNYSCKKNTRITVCSQMLYLCIIKNTCCSKRTNQIKIYNATIFLESNFFSQIYSQFSQNTSQYNRNKKTNVQSQQQLFQKKCCSLYEISISLKKICTQIFLTAEFTSFPTVNFSNQKLACQF
eukprot:TRINITY_DN6605_c0_g2_i4.p1 TRINITY_DN6605_c0_g2~~TRINITY_DN6605_c0_g2_i4.p1  ORF type:complete len:223 (+),score=-6.84 TRINITY_DN6605_c0_g2_i4:1481-2149(+)